MKTNKILHWTPRILCIAAILLISLFALDAFGPGMTFWQQIAAFLVHLIPSFILLALLIVAWRWELAGGLVFTVVALAFSPFIFVHNYHMNNSVWMSLGIVMIINLPFLIVGLLFIASHFKKRSLKQVGE